MMIDFIYLKKTGLYTRFAKKYSKIDQPIYYLHHTPVFEKGFTVLDLMKILKEHEQEVDLIFMAYTQAFKLDFFYEEMVEPIKKDKSSKINYLEFSWSGDIFKLNEFGKLRYEISDYVEITAKKNNDKERYGIGLSDLNEIKDATFKLDNSIEFKTTDYGEIWDKKAKPVTKFFFKGIKAFVFKDIVGTFLHEITFYGYKEHKTKFIESLEKSKDESEQGRLTPHEVILLKWSKEELIEWQNKKDSKNKTLKIEKLEKEIKFLEIKIEELKIKYKDKNYNFED